MKNVVKIGLLVSLLFAGTTPVMNVTGSETSGQGTLASYTLSITPSVAVVGEGITLRLYEDGAVHYDVAYELMAAGGGHIAWIYGYESATFTVAYAGNFIVIARDPDTHENLAAADLTVIAAP
jgi:hypothetical protein